MPREKKQRFTRRPRAAPGAMQLLHCPHGALAAARTDVRYGGMGAAYLRGQTP